ncbi:MAG: hypothetical protein ABSA70_14535, partial [Terriglobia bacterium]
AFTHEPLLGKVVRVLQRYDHAPLVLRVGRGKIGDVREVEREGFPVRRDLGQGKCTSTVFRW